MITDFFLNSAYFVVHGLLSFFPSGSGFPAPVHTAVQYMASKIYILDPLVPWSTLATVVGLVFGIEIAIFGFRTFKWLLSFIPVFGGRGI